LLFGLLTGDPQARLEAFWERRVADPAARELIAACLDPGHPHPVRNLQAPSGAMRRLGAVSGSDGDASGPTRRGWWSPWRARRSSAGSALPAADSVSPWDQQMTLSLTGLRL
jgi:hypothetical protein